MTETRPMPRKIFLRGWLWWGALAGVILASFLTDTLWFLLVLIALLFIQGIYVFHLADVRAAKVGSHFSKHSFRAHRGIGFGLFAPDAKLIGTLVRFLTTVFRTARCNLGT
jgi:hypothetical protein